MEILNAEQLNEKLVYLINKSREIYFMVAWATDSSRAFEAMKKNRHKIKKAVIGTHFYQTSPKFIKEFLDNNQIRYIKLPSGVFHPKVYLFICSDDDVQVIIGSSNFTHGGLSSNYELSILTNRKKDGVIVDRLFKEIGKKFSEAERYSADQLEEYELKWKHNKPIRAKLAVSQKVSTIDNTHYNINTDIQNLTWNEYVTLVESDEIHSLKGRVRVLKESRKLFKKGFGNEGRSHLVRMNPVPGNIGGMMSIIAALVDGPEIVIEDLLQIHKGQLIFLGQLAADIAVLVHSRPHGILRADFHIIGCHQHHSPGAGFGFSDHLPQILLIFSRHHLVIKSRRRIKLTPDIIDANHNAHHVGLQADDISVEAFQQIPAGVAADA